MTNQPTYIMHIAECTADLVGKEFILKSTRSFTERIMDLLLEEINEKASICTHSDELRVTLEKLLDGSFDVFNIRESIDLFELDYDEETDSSYDSIKFDLLYEYTYYLCYNIPLVLSIPKEKLKKNLLQEFSKFLKEKPKDARYWSHSLPIQLMFDTNNLRSIWEQDEKLKVLDFHVFDTLLSTFIRNERIQFETNNRIIF